MAKLTRETDHYEALGRRVEALLASEEPPPEFREFTYAESGSYTTNSWRWFREQLLGPVEAVPLPPPANIPEAGRGPLLGSLATGGATGEAVHRDYCHCGRPATAVETDSRWPCGAQKDEEETRDGE